MGNGRDAVFDLMDAILVVAACRHLLSYLDYYFGNIVSSNTPLPLPKTCGSLWIPGLFWYLNSHERSI